MENEVRCALAGRLKAGFGLESEAFISVPGRTELIGNHTDHQRGCVVAAAVTLSLDAAAARTGDGRIRVLSEGMEPVDVALDSLDARPSEHGSSAALVRGVAAGFAERGFLPGKTGLALAVSAGVPVGSGLSSSACFEVLVAAAMDAMLFGSGMSAAELARIAQFAENEYFGKPCGLLDQAAVALGGVQELDFAAGCAAARVDFDFGRCGHRMCVVDTRSAHADLTADYAAIADECRAVAARFGAETLREVDEGAFYGAIPELRRSLGDRAVLRAMHVFAENARAGRAAGALRRGDFAAFLREVDASGRSSAELLQNLWPGRDAREQPLALALALARGVLGGAGACRVHGGGFGGTMLAFVPEGLYGEFSRRMEAVFGPGSCLALSVRSAGAGVIEI